MNRLPYDETSPESIYQYSRGLICKSFRAIREQAERERFKYGGIYHAYEKTSQKGRLGNIIEEDYFYYKANNNPEPDFPRAGVELKVVPYIRNTHNEIRAKERVSLTMIDYNHPVDDRLETSHLWYKCRLILFVCYYHDKEIKDNLEYIIYYTHLFTPPAADYRIIENDYKIIVGKIKAGKAHELSEGDTLYLGAATKGETAATSTVPQYYGDHTPARKRTFCYKNSYMTVIMREYITTGKQVYEPLIRDVSELAKRTLPEIIQARINRYIGKSDEELCDILGVEYNENKLQWIKLAWRMLGIKSNQAEEFEKANIKVKAIRLEENGTMTESMSFPVYRYKELINEEWDTSTVYKDFGETIYLFVVFRRRGYRYYLKGCQLWNMPYNDIMNEVKTGWERIVEIIRNGVELTITYDKKGKPIVRNNFPEKDDNRIIHTRPHASHTYYEFADGTIIGNPKHKNGNSNQLPNGDYMPNYCFWLNNTYIVEQLRNDLKE